MRAVVVLFLVIAPALPQDDAKRVTPRKEGQVAVRLIGPAGDPVEARAFASTYHCPRGGGSGPCKIIAQQDATYVIEPMDWERQIGPGGTHTLRLHTKRHGALQQVFNPAAKSDVVVRIRPAASVNVKLAGYAKRRRAWPILVAIKRQGEADRQFGFHGSEVDVDGEKWLSPVQSGPSEILVGVQMTPGWSHLFWAVARVPVHLEPGKNEITIPTPVLHTVTVTGTPDTRFRISPVGKLRDVYIEYVVVDPSGGAVISDLGTGAYEFSGNLNGRPFKVIATVPKQTVVKLP